MKIQLLINQKIDENIKKFNIDGFVECEISKIKGLDNHIININLLKNTNQFIEYAFKVLGNIKEYLDSRDIQFYEIRNECSLYFQKILYPKLQNFECGLRKLLQIAMCDAEEVLDKAYKRLSDKLSGGKKQEIVEKYGFINATDLSDIFEFLFVDKTILQPLKEKFSDTNWNLMNDVKDIKINSLWNCIFKQKYEGFELDKFCKDLYNIRNDVMHFHNIDFKSFKEYLKLINKLNKQLERQLDKNIVLELSEYKDCVLIEENIFYNFRNLVNRYNEVMQYDKIKEIIHELTSGTSEFRKQIESLQLENKKINEIAKLLSKNELIKEINNLPMDKIKDIHIYRYLIDSSDK